MCKIDINNRFLYEFDKPNLKERTKSRLIEISDLGMTEVGIYSFGIKGKMSGLYLEKVWSYSEKEWKNYIEWVKSIIENK